MTTETVNPVTRTSIPAPSRPWVVITLIVLVFSSYFNTLSNGLLWDDTVLVSDNPQIRNLRYVSSAFTADLFHRYSVPVATHYRPMQTVSYIFDYRAWGLDPTGYHLTNLLLHLVCTLLLAALLVRLTGENWIALLGAALFAVHPVNTNAIAYVSGRADPLAFGFMLTALLCYVHYRKNPARRLFFFTLSAFAYIAALFSRENAFVFPLLIAVLVYSTEHKRLRAAGFAALPFAVIALIFACWRHAVLAAQGKPIESGYTPAMFDRIVVFFRSIATYVGLLIWPSHLQMERQLSGGTFAGVALSLGLLIWIIWAWRKSPVALFGLLWFVVSLAPVAGLIALNAPVAEHWLYVPAVGLFTAFATVLMKSRQPNPVVLILCLAAVTALALRTVRRNRDWASPLTLFTVTKQAAPYSAGVRANLGQELRAQGNTQRALAELENAERLGATDMRVRANLAALYQADGNLPKAQEIIEGCLHDQPQSPVVLLRAASIADDQDDSRRAERYYILVIGTTTDTRAWLQYGAFLFKHQRYQDALSIVGTCRSLDPYDANTWNLLGAVLAERRQFSEARTAFEQARQLDAHSPDAEINLGRMATDSKAAEEHFQRALVIAPGDPRALFQLSRLAWQRGDRTLARQYLDTAHQSAPDSRAIEEALQKLDRGEVSPYSADGSPSSGPDSFR